MARVGVDVGGTNTDLVLEADHGVFVHKVSSTPHDQSEGVLKGLRELCDISGVRPDDVSLIVHGTTVATNITIEHNGAEVGMLTSRNFRDILHIGRHKRPHNFSLHFEVPWQQRPLVKRRNRIAVTERVLPPDGTVEILSTKRKSSRRRGCSSAAASSPSSSAFCFRFSTTHMSGAPPKSFARKCRMPISARHPKSPTSSANTNDSRPRR